MGWKDTIHFGDCLEILPSIPDKSIDFICCDLPYGITKCEWDICLPLDVLWKEYKRIIKDNCGIALFANQPFASQLVLSNLKWFKYEWVWDKYIPRNFVKAKYRPMNRHENILIFGKEKVNYYPQMTLRDKPVIGCNYSKRKVSGNCVTYNSGKKYTYTHKYPDTIIQGLWEANAGKYHPTQKPVKLYEYLIRTYTQEGALVLDNCAGSGNIGQACKNTKRHYILIEKEKEYFDIIHQRLELDWLSW